MSMMSASSLSYSSQILGRVILGTGVGLDSTALDEVARVSSDVDVFDMVVMVWYVKGIEGDEAMRW